MAEHLGSQGLRSNTRTFYEAVRKVPSGSMLTVDVEGRRREEGKPRRMRTRITRHWHPEDTPAAPPASDDAYAEEVSSTCMRGRCASASAVAPWACI